VSINKLCPEKGFNFLLNGNNCRTVSKHNLLMYKTTHKLTGRKRKKKKESYKRIINREKTPKT
jgi:hypothetical protein